MVASIPYGGRPIIVRASARLLDGHDYAQKTEVWPCPRRVFALESYTGNFSPHLGEEMGFTVAIPGCLHERDPGWLEAEIMRETTAGWRTSPGWTWTPGRRACRRSLFPCVCALRACL